MTRKRVALLLAPGYEELEAVTVVDILRRAEIECDIIGVQDGPIPSARNVKILPDRLLDDILDETYDIVVLPGGIEGTENLSKDERVVALLTRQLESGKRVAAICAAPTVLERHDLVTGRTITCHPISRTAIKKANLTDDKVAEDGLIITSQGPGTAMEFALKLVEVLAGKDKVTQLKEALLVK